MKEKGNCVKQVNDAPTESLDEIEKFFLQFIISFIIKKDKVKLVGAVYFLAIINFAASVTKKGNGVLNQ